MSEESQLQSVMPGFPVRDMDRAVSFYTRELGFHLTFRNGAIFSIVCRDAVEVTLSLAPAGRDPGPAHCYVRVTGVDDFHREFRERGVTMTHPLRDEEYGMREFMVTDPDGNTLNFGEPIP